MPSHFSLSFPEPLCSPNDSNRDEHIAMATKTQKPGKVCSPDHSLCLWDHLWHWYREWLWEGTHLGLSFLAGGRMCSAHEAPLINSPGCTIDGRMEGRFLSLSPYVGQHDTCATCRTQRLRPALCLPSVLEDWCKTQLKGESQHWHRVPGEKHMQGKFLSPG